MNRKQFILSSSSSLLVYSALGYLLEREKAFASSRPMPAARKFKSEAIEQVIKEVKSSIASQELQWLFENCFPNTLDTTVFFSDEGEYPDTFVITGDIDAMWLRDSSAQVWPYLPYVNQDPLLQRLLAGVIHRQTKCILLDPYANAFYKDNRTSEWRTDHTEMKPFVHERKWEVDSLCYTIRLAFAYYKTTGDKTPFNKEWLQAVGLILQTFREQQRKKDSGPYHFQRSASGATDTLCCNGFGKPVNPIGLICSAFRPSDDSTNYLFLIPSNYFALVSLQQLHELMMSLYPGHIYLSEIESLRAEIQNALAAHGVVEHPGFGKIIPYEIDGFGHSNLMDDANVPSLLSLPYLNAVQADDVLYQNTRKFVLSKSNPYFFKGKSGEGIGGPHVGKDMIWPLGIIMRALTSTDEEEIVRCLQMLVSTHAGTGFMHESFHADNPKHFTRKWFAWANTLFGELILKIYKEHPALLMRTY